MVDKRTKLVLGRMFNLHNEKEREYVKKRK